MNESFMDEIIKLVQDNTGPCSCDKMYSERRLIDPRCAWHQYGDGIAEDLLEEGWYHD